MTTIDPHHLLEHSDCIAEAADVEAALDRVAAAISADIASLRPLVLPVMGGAVVFAGRLLPRLAFPLEFDYLHVTRYRGKTRGGEIEWRVMPGKGVAGKHVLVEKPITRTLAEASQPQPNPSPIVPSRRMTRYCETAGLFQ